MTEEAKKRQLDGLKTGHMFTKENAREMQLRGAEKKKQNRLMRESMQNTIDMLLRKTIKKGAQVDPEDFLSIADAEGQNISVQQAIVLAQIQKALNGDINAATFIRDTLGEKPVEKIETGVTIEDYVKNHKVKF